ncbi:MAG: DegT/DnrJ/EryC1/StrS family aminotransferase [Syntrophobacterales bacterium]|jgi:dTDP-4-amino-4,6-dideoxygalactose transaminase|nr:DegT/DnrJ/EryC1/StrS family aminotransferase [Syntrophobacterales bacterium]
MRRELQVARPLFPEPEVLLQRLKSVLASGRLMNGKFTEEFEEQFADFSRRAYAVSVNSCTTALEIVLKYIGVADGEVIIPTNTFIATPNAALFAGATPVLADIKPGTYFLDPGEVRRLISPKTRAVIVVHIAGYIPPEVEEIKAICETHAIPLIEDCAHATGASHRGKMAGAFGMAGCFSFYPTKIITTGTGGMIVTNDGDLRDYARSLRIHGAGKGLTDITNIGNDWFLDEIRSCMGLNQLENMEYFLLKRREIAAYYDGWVNSTGLMEKYLLHADSRHAYYKYPVQITTNIDVGNLKRNFFEKKGYELESVYWPTCHLQPVYQKNYGYHLGLFPVAEATLSRQVTLPLHAALTKDDAEYAFECLLTELEDLEEQRDKA